MIDDVKNPLAVAAKLMGLTADNKTLERARGMYWHRDDSRNVIRIGSDEDCKYEIRRGGDGVVYCTCPGWINRKRFNRDTCKHLTFCEVEGVEFPTRTWDGARR
jgi:hypothetical protein